MFCFYILDGGKKGVYIMQLTKVLTSINYDGLVK